MIHAPPPPFTPDPRSAEVEALTGFALNWTCALPVPVWHALQWHGPGDTGRCGLIWSEPTGYGYAALRFDPRLYARHGLEPADLAAVGLECVGVTTTVGIPRAFRRSVRIKRIPAQVVERC